ncbi:hypothetical protein [Secundilactobacillus silagei]|uniref:Methyl-accepting chemotaxis protein n=1 Tax=Secundilactobacillus silagei JCM 19001 TaxID=1302250 RepID=A0A1Z5IGG3_9LACO|nr:hypothetical protein [Secundilactobacillus silagei]TDG69147.1 hypothetical protein C5L25_000078 [Secundilactobacillus silagei JCM 19001]GAX00870.1 hypothetical protein IWT126_00889 [Secundilactobacillus silagei JCM 19001]
MKPKTMASYLPALTKVIEDTEKTGSDMNPDFEKLRQAIDADTVADLGTDTLTAIKATFQKGTDAYTENLNRLQQAAVPVRILGRHKQLVAAYRNYSQACQTMVDTIDPEGQTVNVEAFNDSEHEQENMMGKISSAAQRIMAMVM